jgi:Domain of unknown function (DUF4234)
MSTSALVDTAAVDVKTRRVRSVVLLTVVTFGIYGVVWYYKINRELRDFGAAHGDAELGSSRPWSSLLAITIGGAIELPRLISFVRMTRRMQAAERIAFGYARTVSMEMTALVASVALPWGGLLNGIGWVDDLAACACFLLAMGLIQSRLNAAWQAAANPAQNSLAGASERYADTCH